MTLPTDERVDGLHAREHDVGVFVKEHHAPTIAEDRCNGCGTCIMHCPTGALVQPEHLGCDKCVKYCMVMEVPCRKVNVVVVSGRCDGCGICVEICPCEAITMPSGHGLPR